MFVEAFIFHTGLPNNTVGHHLVQKLKEVKLSLLFSHKKREPKFGSLFDWLRGEDSNLRPLGYEPNELPTALPRDIGFVLYNIIILHYLKIYVNSMTNFYKIIFL